MPLRCNCIGHTHKYLKQHSYEICVNNDVVVTVYSAYHSASSFMSLIVGSREHHLDGTARANQRMPASCRRFGSDTRNDWDDFNIRISRNSEHISMREQGVLRQLLYHMNISLKHLPAELQLFRPQPRCFLL